MKNQPLAGFWAIMEHLSDAQKTIKVNITV